MYQGNWQCSSCGGSITELPFQPRRETGLTCRSCYLNKNNRNKTTEPPTPDTNDLATEAPEIPDFAELAGEPEPADHNGDYGTPVTSEKPRFTGSWQCSVCSSEITSLPFSPRSTDNLKCLDCFKQGKG